MKLVIVTAVEEFQNDIIKLFKQADIESFSSSDIDGYKNIPTALKTSSWFSSGAGRNESCLFFSFTDDTHIDALFNLIEVFNTNLETNNPIKVVVVPIERHI